MIKFNVVVQCWMGVMTSEILSNISLGLGSLLQIDQATQVEVLSVTVLGSLMMSIYLKTYGVCDGGTRGYHRFFSSVVYEHLPGYDPRIVV